MTAPDPGLTDLIAAALVRSSPNSIDTFDDLAPHRQEAWRVRAREVALAVAVEQHANGRIAELGWDELVAAIPDGWELQESAQLEEVSRARQRDLEASQATTARWRDRAEKAEATITRVITALEAAEKSVPDDWGVTYIYTSQLRAALEGEQQ